MSFLPEDDQEYLQHKGLKYVLKEESGKRGVLFPEFTFTANLCRPEGSALVPCATCELLVLIPDGYDTTKLDSFYTNPVLKRANGALPDRATDIQTHFGGQWQFWSRHISDDEWKESVRGLEVWMDYIRQALRDA